MRGNYGDGEDTRIYLEKLKAVHKEFMQKSDDYERIHNEFVQSEQVSYTIIVVFVYLVSRSRWVR